jgi:hypothetical protein
LLTPARRLDLSASGRAQRVTGSARIAAVRGPEIARRRSKQISLGTSAFGGQT